MGAFRPILKKSCWWDRDPSLGLANGGGSPQIRVLNRLLFGFWEMDDYEDDTNSLMRHS